jgi:mannose-6-phosphate isomerase-like protein (cupin superfamily)
MVTSASTRPYNALGLSVTWLSIDSASIREVWEGYVHDTDELVMVVERDVEFEIDRKVHRPAPGEELFIPARARHTVRNLGHGESRWLYGYRR